MHWPALGTVIPYQAIPDPRVKYASKSKPLGALTVSARNAVAGSARTLNGPGHVTLR